MTDKPEKKGKRTGVWAEVHSITEPNTKLTVVIAERGRGRKGRR